MANATFGEVAGMLACNFGGGQFLAPLECPFLWRAYHFVKFWQIAGARTVIFAIQNALSRWDREALRIGRRHDLGSWSDHARIVFIGAEAIHRFSCCSAHSHGRFMC